MQLSLLPSPPSTGTIAGAKWPESATKDRKFPSLVFGLQHSDTAFIITSDTLLAQVLPVQRLNISCLTAFMRKQKFLMRF